jgi:tRNA(fMet)-specific endonuclease VapC
VARLILDSSVLIGVQRGRRLDRLIRDEDDVAIASITAAELLVGVHLADDGRRAGRLKFVRSVLDTIPVEVYDVSVAHVHSELLAHVQRSGRPRGAHDLLIAATAAASGRTVVTGDPAAFEGLPGVAVSA